MLAGVNRRETIEVWTNGLIGVVELPEPIMSMQEFDGQLFVFTEKKTYIFNPNRNVGGSPVLNRVVSNS